MRVVYETNARSTGTHVYVVDNRDGSFDSDDPNAWFDVCEDHGCVVSHTTRALAESFASCPEEWCPGCQGEDARATHVPVQTANVNFRGNG